MNQIRAVSLASLGFVSGIEEAVNCMDKFPVEDSHRGERHIKQAMVAGSLHQLNHATRAIDVHDDE